MDDIYDNEYLAYLSGEPVEGDELCLEEIEETEYADKYEELEQLEEKLFMLQMADHWDAEDYKLSDELHSEIMTLRKELNMY